MTTTRQAAALEPVARVLPMLTVPHLDREFDYLVSEDQSGEAQPGVRVRVRFHGRLVDAFVLERRSDTDHAGKLGWIDKVVSPERVLTHDVGRLVDAVAARYAGTRADVLRLAVPPRHAGAEKKPSPQLGPPSGSAEPPEMIGWSAYAGGAQFITALGEGRAARAGWQALPGEPWSQRLAEAAAVTVNSGRGVLAVVPDQRDVDQLYAAALTLVEESRVVALSAGLGAGERYRRWLSVLRGDAQLVIGTRSAVFAPVMKLGLVVMWDDGDDSLAEPRAPYPHAREVAMLRAHQAGCAALLGGFARTAEVQALVRGGWAHDLVAPRQVLRSRAPHAVALEDSAYAQERDAAARTARLPSVALDAARAALAGDAPVLVQVPRRGYVPALACGRCRTVARCRQCTGPLSLPGRDTPGAVCRWCGRDELTLSCARCGSDAVRAVVVGARRTAEELGRAFPGVPVITSGGEDVVDRVPDRPALVVSTPGVEPTADGGYGAALLLDAWALLGRQDLRATEDTLRRWMAASALVRSREGGGVVVVVAESALATVQSLIRWDPIGHAEQELDARNEVGLPPAVHLAAVDGTPAAVSALLDSAELPRACERVGPVDLPVGARRPPGVPPDLPVSRILVRVPRDGGPALAAALRRASSIQSARHEYEPVRVQIDPLHIG